MCRRLANPWKRGDAKLQGLNRKMRMRIPSFVQQMMKKPCLHQSGMPASYQMVFHLLSKAGEIRRRKAQEPTRAIQAKAFPQAEAIVRHGSPAAGDLCLRSKKAKKGNVDV